MAPWHVRFFPRFEHVTGYLFAQVVIGHLKTALMCFTREIAYTTQLSFKILSQSDGAGEEVHISKS